MHEARHFKFRVLIQYKKSEVLSFTNYKDMIGAKFKNGSRDSDHSPFRGGVSS